MNPVTDELRVGNSLIWRGEHWVVLDIDKQRRIVKLSRLPARLYAFVPMSDKEIAPLIDCIRVGTWVIAGKYCARVAEIAKASRWICIHPPALKLYRLENTREWFTRSNIRYVSQMPES